MLSTLLLTAGFGTRLDPITRLVAKPAVPLGERSLVEHVLAWLGRQGVRDVVINLHHRPASLTRIVGDGRHLGFNVRYSWEQPLLGSAGGPRHALPLLESDPFFIVNGDTLCDVDLRTMLAAHAASGAAVTMAVVPNPAPHHYNGIVADVDGVVTGFRPRGEAAGTWHFVGIQIAHAHVFANLPDGEAAESVSGIYRDLVRTYPGQVRVFPVPSAFIDVGTPSDYLHAALHFGHAAAPASTDRPARLVRSIVWPSVTVGANVDIEECIAIGDVHLPPGFRARRAVLAPASIVQPGERADVREGVGVFAMEPSGDRVIG